MTYELAKKLKDAGFPMPKVSCHECDQRREYVSDRDYTPDLSELIEACVEDFLDLSKIKGNKLFRASAWIGEQLHAFDGSTPEEAVAKLWLELNK